MKNPITGSQTFSMSWAVGIFVLHVALSLGLSLLIFVSGMANFTTGTGWLHSLLVGVLFIVSPPLMIEMTGSSVSGFPTFLLALFWSMLVAGLSGWIRALSRRPVVYPEPESDKAANPDLAGTPWASDPHFVRGATGASKEPRGTTRRPS